MLCFALQTHSCSKRLICLAYLNKTKSKNSRLIEENLLSLNGKDDNHIEATSDVAILHAFNCDVVTMIRRFLSKSS